MATRRLQLITNEYYHVFNRGVDKRDVFLDEEDFKRFLQSMEEFNVVEPIGSIYENSFRKTNTQLGGRTAKLGAESEKLVNFVCYCLNSNHYHFLLKQVTDRGIEKFMQRLGGYTWYFNKKYKRSGALFQGKYKFVHINSNEQLLHTSVYINLNYKVHKLGGRTAKSSWDEYVNKNKNNFCSKDIILKQFKNYKEYELFAKTSLEWIKENKEAAKLLLE